MTATLRKPRILVIDDEPDLRELLELLLIHAGCQVGTAGSGLEGLRLAETGGYDLITLDIDLPQLNGFEICSRLRQNPALCGIPVVFVTGRLDESDRCRAVEAGATDYITKPFDGSTFVARLFSHLKSPPPATGPAAGA